MQPESLNNDRRRPLVGALLAVMAIPVGFVGLVAYEIRASHQDYEQVESCLQEHGFVVQDGWQHTDILLEDFGLVFEMQNGQQWEVQILDGSSVRNCGDRISGIFLSSNKTDSPDRRYLPLDHPDLLEALNGQEVHTLSDVFAQLDWLLTWAQAHPDALLSHDEVSHLAGYVSLLSPPL